MDVGFSKPRVSVGYKYTTRQGRKPYLIVRCVGFFYTQEYLFDECLTNYILINLFIAVILENFELDQNRSAQEQELHRREIWRQMIEHFIAW
eukprot:COSAG05_NODE_37_length_27688_cov_18.080394_25_plen_92_part_00